MAEVGACLNELLLMFRKVSTFPSEKGFSSFSSELFHVLVRAFEEAFFSCMEYGLQLTEWIVSLDKESMIV